MTRLEELIERLCPDGVEYKTIKQIADVSIGEFVRKDKQSPNAKFPVFNGGTSNTGFYDEYNQTANKIIISARGANAGFVNRVFTNFWSGNSCYTIDVIDQTISWNYLYYWLKSKESKLLNEQQKGGIPAVSKKQVENFLTPVPPLEVQQEIVRILDQFTQLTAELTAELAARKQQQQYYTQYFYNRIKENGAPIVRVKDVCDLLTGFPFDSTQFSSEGVHLLRGMNIKRGYLDYSETNNRYWNSIKGYEKYLLSANDIVIAMDGSLVGKSYGQVKEQHIPALLVQRVTRVRATKVNPNYLYHYISSGAFTNYVEQKKTGGAVPHISMKDIENFTFPLPSEKIQEEVSEILDRFDALCNDLTSGLPAEIAARQKQYEYYRDKLLSFPERKP